jgi:hypothetical protein
MDAKIRSEQSQDSVKIPSPLELTTVPRSTVTAGNVLVIRRLDRSLMVRHIGL